jgi:hypothetical protein
MRWALWLLVAGLFSALVGCGDDDPAPAPDAGPPDAGEPDAGEADAGPGDIVCTPEGVDMFRMFDRRCTAASECAAVQLQVDCCGSLLVTGINAAGVAEFEEAATICRSMYPACDCPALMPRTDDGSRAANPDLATVDCVGMACRTSF